jgi:hypothetical protein
MDLKFFIIAAFLSFVHLANADENWKLELEKEGITVYTRISERSHFKEFRGEITLNASITEIAGIIADVERYPEWCYKTTLVTVIDNDSVSTRYYYVSQTPAFMKTRVGFFESRRMHNRQTGEVIFSLHNYESGKELSDDCLLIPIMEGYWRLTPLDGGMVHITMQMLTEPGGIIPAWIANMVVVDSPFVTLRNLVARLKAEK